MVYISESPFQKELRAKNTALTTPKSANGGNVSTPKMKLESRAANQMSSIKGKQCPKSIKSKV